MIYPFSLASIHIGLFSEDHKLIELFESMTISQQQVKKPFDLILVDDTLLASIDQIRSEVPTTTPLLLLIDPEKTSPIDALKLGFSDYILKPCKTDLILHRIRQTLNITSPPSDDRQQALNEEYETILSSMSDPIFVMNRQGMYVRIPTNQANNYYLAPADMLGKTLYDIFPDDIADNFIHVIHQALDTQNPQQIDYELVIDDQLTYFSAVVNPIQGRDEVVWVTRDITNSRLNANALAEAEKQYRQLFENANDMIMIIDLESGMIIDANKQTQKQLGYSLEELKQLEINEIEEPLHDSQSRLVTRTLITHGHIILEQIYRTKDGSQIPVETSNRITVHGDKQVLLSFSRDIKQRKSAMKAEAEERYFAEVLRDTIAQLALALTMNDVLDVMIATVGKVVDSESIHIMLVEDDKAVVKRTLGFHDEQSQPAYVPIQSTFTFRHMYETQQAIIITDTDLDPRWVKFSKTSWSKSYVGAPINLKGETIGFINLDSSIPNHFTNKHRQRLQIFADQAAIAIQNAQLYEASQRYTEDLEARVTERTVDLTNINQKLITQIEKRKQAEEKLAQERNILRTIINSLPVTVYVKNRQSQYTLTNRFPYLTAPKQDVIGKSDLDILSNKEVAQSLFENEQRLMTEQVSETIEDYVIDPDGTEHWVIRSKIPFVDDNGEVTGLVGVNQDITKIKLAERQLRQLLSNAQCLLWYANVEYDGENYIWDIKVENEDTANDFLTFDNNEQDYTQAWLNSIPTDHQNQRKVVAHTHLKYNKSNYTLEYNCITADGETHWLNEDVQIQPLTENRWLLIGVSLDISEIKAAEFALRESHTLMEHRVIERTAELRHANDKLQREILIRQQAEEAERQQRMLAEALKDSITAMNSTLDIEDVLDHLLNAILLVVNHTASNIMLIDGNSLVTVRHRGYNYNLNDLKLDEFQEIYTVYHTQKPYLIVDTQTNPDWTYWEPSKWIRSSLKLPILDGNSVIGIINLDSDEPNQFTMEHTEILSTFANQASIALKNAQLYQQAQAEIAERQRAENAEREQREFAEAMRDSAILLNQKLKTNDVFDTILGAIDNIIQVHDAASIIIINKQTLIGRLVRSMGFDQFNNTDGLIIDFNQSPSKQQLIEEHKPLFISDTHESDLWIQVEGTEWIRSHVGIPISIQDDTIALVSLDSRLPNCFTLTHVEQLVTFSHQAAIAIKNSQLVEQIQSYTQQLESRVQQRTAELEIERSQLRAILDAMRDGVYYSRSTQVPFYINNALSEITGYTREQWLSGEVFDYINSDLNFDRDKIWQTIEKHLQRNHFWYGEARLVRADGTKFDASLVRTKVEGPDGVLQGIVTVVRDISLQKQLEEQKARFIANAAHELRTPITNIKTRLFLMKHQPDKFSEHMQIAESATNWMQTLVDNLFEHSRFERGIIQLYLEDIFLNEFLELIIQTQQPEASRKEINILFEAPLTPIHLQGDVSRLRQVITNLINYAINYTPEKGTIRVDLIIHQEKEEITISISDTGIGIDESHLPNLFQPFYRANDESKGAGLGLSIARDIIEAHDGSIDVTSKVGQGTTFYVHLPIIKQHETN